MNPTLTEFKQLSKKYNLIPVWKDTLADLETPVSSFYKIYHSSPYAYLLESVERGERIGRYSFLAGDPALIFKSKGKEVFISLYPFKSFKSFPSADPLTELKKMMQKYKPAKLADFPPFYGGAVGYLGYDFVRFFESIPRTKPDDLNLPDSFFVFTDTILIFDHLLHKIKVVSCAHIKEGEPLEKIYQSAAGKVEGIISQLKKPLSLAPFSRSDSKLKISSNFTKEEFKKVVLKAKGYIHRGDIIQVVLSQRLKTKFSADPFQLYRALRIVNPSPYMFYLKLGDLKLVGSSPELLVKLEGSQVQEKPIAGTRPRGRDLAEDLKLEKELLADPKERAEHIMLVDLARNDLGRVTQYRSVNVPALMRVEKYSHVQHIVSDVGGILSKNEDAFSVLRACFPAGTVSGAPKVRAMEIIEELEPNQRGVYAGAVGYLSFPGNLDTAIAIRTLVLKNNTAYLQAGAGIVADSVPEKEYQETLNKARALLKALELVKNGGLE